MRIGITVLALAILAAVTIGLRPRSPDGVMAVSDAEAAALYGGGCDAVKQGNKCGEGETEPGCSVNSGVYSLGGAGSYDIQNYYCGARGCGFVPKVIGTCE